MSVIHKAIDSLARLHVRVEELRAENAALRALLARIDAAGKP